MSSFPNYFPWAYCIRYFTSFLPKLIIPGFLYFVDVLFKSEVELFFFQTTYRTLHWFDVNTYLSRGRENTLLFDEPNPFRLSNCNQGYLHTMGFGDPLKHPSRKAAISHFTNPHAQYFSSLLLYSLFTHATDKQSCWLPCHFPQPECNAIHSDNHKFLKRTISATLKQPGWPYW